MFKGRIWLLSRVAGAPGQLSILSSIFRSPVRAVFLPLELAAAAVQIACGVGFPYARKRAEADDFLAPFFSLPFFSGPSLLSHHDLSLVM
jgi:hypothetical protein